MSDKKEQLEALLRKLGIREDEMPKDFDDDMIEVLLLWHKLNKRDRHTALKCMRGMCGDEE